MDTGPPLLAAGQTAGDTFLDWLATHGIPVLVALVVALAISIIGRRLVRRMQKKLDAEPRATGAVDVRRRAAIVSVVTNFVRVVVWTVFVLLVLGQFNINLAPLIAGASVVGAGLAFGAQAIVRDFLAGFFVLTEDQYAVGDVVELGVATGATASVAGTVEDLTLRRTAVRQHDGSLITIGNGNVITAQNRSRGLGTLRVEVHVPHAGDVVQVRKDLDRLVEEMRTDPELQKLATDGPTTVGVEPVPGSADGHEVLVVVAAETRASRRDELEREIRRRVHRRFNPLPQGTSDRPSDEEH